MAVTIEVKQPQEEFQKLNTDVDLTTVTNVVEEIKHIDPAVIEAIRDKLHLNPASIAETLHLDPAVVNTVIDKIKSIDPMTIAAVIAQIKMGKIPKVSVGTVNTVLGILSKIPLNDTAKGLLVKLAVFAFGIFCGIGIVYKSGLPLPSDGPVVTPPANVSVYQKRIDELQKINTDLQGENAELRKHLVPPVQPVPPPVITPPPVIRPVPPVNPDGVRPGFIIPLK